jgi:anti-anti-sigma factor
MTPEPPSKMPQPHIVELAGRIDNATSADVESRLSAALDTSPAALVIDFSSVTFVSSIGLRALLMTAKRCRSQNVKFAIHSVSPAIEEVFGISGLTAFLPTYSSREAALAAVS